MKIQYQSFLIGKIAMLMLGLALTGCGLHLSSDVASATPNDPVPAGLVLYQGQFFPSNGATASGTASVYLSGGENILHIAGVLFGVPNNSGLIISINGSNRVVATFTLTSVSGTQNYTFATTSTQLVSVTIHSNPNNVDYASALLTAVTH